MCTSYLMLLGYDNEGNYDGLDMWLGWWRQGMHTKF